MRRLRMTTRRWFLVMACLALPLAAWHGLELRAEGLRRAKDYEMLARSHEGWVRIYSFRRNRRGSDGEWIYKEGFFGPDGNMKKPYARERTRFQAYHAALARKYRYAASHPWSPVEPDPPAPELTIPPE